jgi:hypothetical protein
MSTGRRVEVPNAAMLKVHLEEERDPEIRLRLTLLNLIVELPEQITLEEIRRGMQVPMSTAYVWIRAWRQWGYHGIEKYQGQTTVFGLYRQIELIGVGRRFSRSAGRAGPGAPTDHRRDLLLKASTAQDKAAIGRLAKGVQGVLRDRVGEEFAVPGASRLVRIGQVQIQRVRRDHGIGNAERVAAVTRPEVLLRRANQACAHRIELDVALAGEEVAVGLDERRAEAPFEERPGAMVGAVDGLHVALAEPLHQPSGSAVGRGRHQQMQMVGHQDVGVDAHRLAFRERGQGRRKHAIIVLADEDRGPIDTPQNDVHGEAGGDDADVPAHTERSLSRSKRWTDDSRKPWSVPGFHPS